MHLHLKRDRKSCFVNNYFSNGLLRWEANTDIQPVYNAHKAVTYMCSYFSKNKDKCSTLMKETLKEAENSDKSKFEMMTNIAKAYMNRDYTYSICQHKICQTRYRICKSEIKIEKMAEDSVELFKRIIDTLIDQMLHF